MNVLKKEHGFECYLDETFTAPDAIMAALVVSSTGILKFALLTNRH